MMVLKKKTIVIITLVLLIVAAGYVSTKYGKVIKVNNDGSKGEQTDVAKNSDASVNTQVAAGYFIDIKLGRENERSVAKQTLNDILNNQNTSKDAKAKAENQLLNIVKYSEKEMVAEALIKSKGFDDALVFMDDSTANVTIKSKNLDAEQVNQVKNIVCKESGLPATKVMVQFRE